MPLKTENAFLNLTYVLLVACVCPAQHIDAQEKDAPNDRQKAVEFLPETWKAQKSEVGGVELATVVDSMDASLDIEARVDSGAASCSINAQAVAVDKKAKSVEFEVENNSGDNVPFKAPLIKMIKIKSSEGRTEWRAKVWLDISLSDSRGKGKVAVTLNDRSRSTYKLLIGRNWLRDRFSVNVSLPYRWIGIRRSGQRSETIDLRDGEHLQQLGLRSRNLVRPRGDRPRGKRSKSPSRGPK